MGIQKRMLISLALFVINVICSANIEVDLKLPGLISIPLPKLPKVPGLPALPGLPKLPGLGAIKEKATEILNKVNDMVDKGKAMADQGNELIDKGKEIVEKADKATEKGKEIIAKAQEMANKGKEIYNKGMDIVEKGKAVVQTIKGYFLSETTTAQPGPAAPNQPNEPGGADTTIAPSSDEIQPSPCSTTCSFLTFGQHEVLPGPGEDKLGIADRNLTHVCPTYEQLTFIFGTGISCCYTLTREPYCCVGSIFALHWILLICLILITPVYWAYEKYISCDPYY